MILYTLLLLTAERLAYFQLRISRIANCYFWQVSPYNNCIFFSYGMLVSKFNSVLQATITITISKMYYCIIFYKLIIL